MKEKLQTWRIFLSELSTIDPGSKILQSRARKNNSGKAKRFGRVRPAGNARPKVDGRCGWEV